MSRTFKPGPSYGEWLDIIITQKHLRHHRARLRNGQFGTSVEGGGIPGGKMTGVEVGVLGVGAPWAQHSPQATIGSERPSGVWGLRDPPSSSRLSWKLPSLVAWRHHCCRHIFYYEYGLKIKMNTVAFENQLVWVTPAVHTQGWVTVTSPPHLCWSLAFSLDPHLKERAERFDLRPALRYLQTVSLNTPKTPSGGSSRNFPESGFVEKWAHPPPLALRPATCSEPAAARSGLSASPSPHLRLCVSIYISLSLCLCCSVSLSPSSSAFLSDPIMLFLLRTL